MEQSAKQFFKNYNRPVVHLRKQNQEGRLGLIFGAGLSISFGLPTWPELVDRIAGQRSVKGENLLQAGAPRQSLPYKTELLYQHFLRKQRESPKSKNKRQREIDFVASGLWVTLLRNCLYRRKSVKIQKILGSHPYLKSLLPIIRTSKLTVTYNFDDYIERALQETRPSSEKDESRGYETITNPWAQFKRNDAVIYHPNGFIPSRSMEMPSDKIIFSESAYVAQSLGNAAGDDAALLNHFSKNTCIFIGLSLNDDSLRNVLIKSADRNPGNFHYYVHHMRNGKKYTEVQKRTITQANFENYNLITIFATDENIKTLAGLITMEKEKFKDVADQCNATLTFVYYVTGPLGVGKSTNINYMRSLSVFDEWLEERISVLAKPWDSLNKSEEKTADDWILKQFELKNNKIRHADPGIYLVDRGPMDPLAFTKPKERAKKAADLIQAYSPDEAGYHAFPGMVLLLDGEPKELELRMKLTDRLNYTAEKLQKMHEDLLAVYGKNQVVQIDTAGLSINQVVRLIAEKIHFDDYSPVEFSNKLELHSQKGV